LFFPHHKTFYREFLDPKNSKALLRIRKHAEDVSFWVATTVVREASLPDRLMCIRKFITIAQLCMDKGNFGTARVSTKNLIFFLF
jgi:hypothetical protein